MTPVARLRRLAAALPALGDDGRWLAERLAEYLDGNESSRLDDILGLLPHAGGEHWRTTERRAERDAAIRALARETGGNAAKIREMILRYGGSSWARDRALQACPARYEGTARQHLFRAFKVADGDVPNSVKQLRRILNEGHRPPAIRVPRPARISRSTDQENSGETSGPDEHRILAGAPR